ncbi:uncharacterized protein BJ171DRAFT_564487 [Polychytrium aggregatum]|uniref:uncharacterized protein n=1 Tax=Polychytrium aggregatum TaxID=110093 RepID=UPI0022FEEB8F|nr:uncharacterized protein BJ171DRAFT_564487 [Polychytrium aggregatum]KAI9209259.1 hypothetical protein BJ171DRAFT_564487 [Polychytrium aggregatum]
MKQWLHISLGLLALLGGVRSSDPSPVLAVVGTEDHWTAGSTHTVALTWTESTAAAPELLGTYQIDLALVPADSTSGKYPLASIVQASTARAQDIAATVPSDTPAGEYSLSACGGADRTSTSPNDRGTTSPNDRGTTSPNDRGTTSSIDMVPTNDHHSLVPTNNYHHNLPGVATSSGSDNSSTSSIIIAVGIVAASAVIVGVVVSCTRSRKPTTWRVDQLDNNIPRSETVSAPMVVVDSRDPQARYSDYRISQVSSVSSQKPLGNFVHSGLTLAPDGRNSIVGSYHSSPAPVQGLFVLDESKTAGNYSRPSSGYGNSVTSFGSQPDPRSPVVVTAKPPTYESVMLTTSPRDSSVYSVSSNSAPSYAGSAQMIPSLPRLDFREVIQARSAEQPDELSIAVGQRVVVLQELPDGWALAESETGQRAYVPLNHLRKLS